MQEQELIKFELLRALSAPVGELLSKECTHKAEGANMSIWTINEEAMVYLLFTQHGWHLAVITAKSKI